MTLVLALTVAAPEAGLAEDLAFHQGHDRTELAMPSDAMQGGTRSADPGVDCHIHCGCHMAAPLDGAQSVAPSPASRPSYASTAEAVSSIFPDRLPRPPRA